MNEQMLMLLQGDKRLYPHELEKQYLHVMKKIIELWHTPLANAYFHGLIMDERGGRQGFPPEVTAEILRLSHTHECTRTVASRSTNRCGIAADNRDRQTPGAPAEAMHDTDTQQDFMRLIEAEEISAIRHFISCGSDLNARNGQGLSPLMISASSGKEEIVRLLVQAGAHIQTRDNAGYTPLHWAAFNGHAGVVKLLLENDSEPNVRSNSGWTPLMLAATRGHLAAVKLLIAAGSDVNLASADGWTALHKATANDCLEIIKVLLFHYADRHMRLHDGRTALSIATQNGNETAISILNALRISC